MTTVVMEMLFWGSLSLAILLAIPIGVFGLECALALLPSRGRRLLSSESRGRCAVLIPAHDEETVIADTLDSILADVSAGDEIVVIADNCTDQTAAIARDKGVRVLERIDPERRGKGYALNFGLAHLRQDSPDVVIVMDADCRVAPGTVEWLATEAQRRNRPIQAFNRSETAAHQNHDPSLAVLGHRFCCLIRPRGAARIGMPCALMGTGMAFPWSLHEHVRFDGDHLAEDKLLGVELTLKGYAPLFCPQAQVSSPMPQQRAAFLGQRRRWEHGHLRLALEHIPRLLSNSIRNLRIRPLWMALDLSVPPLALLILLWMAATNLAAVGLLLGGSWMPLLLLLVEGAVLSTAVAAGWAFFCRHELPGSMFLGIPVYVLRKLPLYATFFLGHGQRAWVRTPRDSPHQAAPAQSLCGVHHES